AAKDVEPGLARKRVCRGHRTVSARNDSSGSSCVHAIGAMLLTASTPAADRQNSAKRPRRSLALLGCIASPHPFDGVRQELRLGIADAVAGVSAEEILVLIALALQHLGHAVVGLDPVVHAIAQDVGVEQVAVPHGNENSQ